MTAGAPIERDDRPLLPPEVEGDDWPTRTRRASLRLRAPTAILLVLLLVALGVWGGAFLQKRYGSHGAAASSPFGAGGFPTGAGGFPSFGQGTSGSRSGSGFTRGSGGFGGGTTGQATSGTVTLARGRVVWVTTSTGGLVKVTIGKNTTVTRTAAGTAKGLQLGDSVVVVGSKKGGAVAATVVRATQKGLSTSGFGAPAGG